MLRYIYLLLFTIVAFLKLNAQKASFSPDLVVGNRSISYQHFIGYKINDRWSINNASLFDTEYDNDKNNILFIRNMLSYNFNKYFKANIALGIKNPGSFSTLTAQYQYASSSLKLSYAIGSTYQNGFTLEQTLSINYTPIMYKNIQGYFNLFAVVNTNLKVLDRGIQNLRLGIKKKKTNNRNCCKPRSVY